MECPVVCTQLASAGVACSDETGQTGGVVEMLAATLDCVVGSSMMTCWNVLQWQPGTLGV